ncbi:MAG: adenosylcobalamin-dependent ribonucleoside-diphosphate reductase, partial [Candidatus Aenigmarchaeota archaeon]|nr:adenosylcobalamin-dependent ribonucleoside-diphosphate reductase [Candidatus Aenigmarchaeota archaeon]MDW8149331.1 adenosylcobalamin-dependent ribonucleoside-diphosphate reductase [Candidatus Aenigmarchaeota archaeon]
CEDSYSRPLIHACFIQSIKDDLVNEGGIMDLLTREAKIFKFGGGSGINFSPLRARGEPLSGGGFSSGVISFLKVFDVLANSIKSGGRVRRSAKMVILNIDHPEIEDFIMWKVNEEKKFLALVKAGLCKLEMEELSSNVFGQNSNNSIRVTNEFIEKALKNEDWNLIARTSKKIVKTVKASYLLDLISKATWECGDPALQYDNTINEWNTVPLTGRINATNPCSEFIFIDNTACNLASLNLVKFYDVQSKTFDVKALQHVVRLWTIVLDISIDAASYPSKEIAENSYKTRPLGLGYTNLGALLMIMNYPYDSEEGRNIAGAITALITAYSYITSAEIASFKGPFPEFEKNKEYMLKVIRNHRRAAYGANKEEFEDLSIKPETLNHSFIPEYISKEVLKAWDKALFLGEKFGYRNAQTTLIAPTGTISLIMDADTTGIEPDYSLVKFKKLADGGFLKIVNKSFIIALKNLGYERGEIEEIVKYVIGHNTLEKAPFINKEKLLALGFDEKDIKRIEEALPTIIDLSLVFNPAFLGKECMERLGFNEKEYMNPSFNLLKSLNFSDEEIEKANEYICGAQTVEGAPYLKLEHYQIFDCAVRCGKKGKRFISPIAHLKMMAKVQPFLSGGISKTVNMPNEATIEDIKNIYLEAWKLGLKSVSIYRDGSKTIQALYSKITELFPKEKTLERRRLPPERKSITHKFRVGNQEGYIHVGLFEDGKPGEIFITISKQGSTLAGLMDGCAILTSMALQYGVPLKDLVNKLINTRFEPSGWTDNKQIPIATSILDYIFKWLAFKFLSKEELEEIGLVKRREEKTIKIEKIENNISNNNIVCNECGNLMIAAGTCFVCIVCGATSGCS